MCGNGYFESATWNGCTRTHFTGQVPLSAKASSMRNNELIFHHPDVYTISIFQANQWMVQVVQFVIQKLMSLYRKLMLN